MLQQFMVLGVIVLVRVLSMLSTLLLKWYWFENIMNGMTVEDAFAVEAELLPLQQAVPV